MRWIARAAAAALAAGIAVAGAAGVAVAHGGEIDVEIGTDGAGGVSASLTWAGDGHPVEDSAVVVVRAVSDDGEEIGPVTLVSASEGVGWYRSDPELLDEGSWTVTARVTEPEKTRVKANLDVVAPPVVEPSASPEPTAEAEAAADGTAPGAVEPGSDAAAAQDADSGAGWPLWVGAVAVVVAGAVVALLLSRRHRT
ncbi:hypothetical protein [Isoptericola dokdonensis]|uniref:CopC domain-containing protein n=1 Tax=Isoptericola dokdonensis DS-3 TaxID=1300344 RepID=A0A168E5G5_9MICO|nr:hypothetical protein [Isoptericola dokdonensis]ANC29637.1 hypothetical protein I598_0038 [Isoptericola dokdonensis DS-3]